MIKLLLLVLLMGGYALSLEEDVSFELPETIPAARMDPIVRNILQVPIRSSSSPLGSNEYLSQAAIVDAISDLAEKTLTAFNVTGLSVGVVMNHEVIFTSGFGMANKERAVPATEHSLFQIASNSKAFTSFLAMMGAEKGKIQLDEPVHQSCEERGWHRLNYKMNTSLATEAVTMRDMMSHRTGLPRHDNIAFAVSSREELAAKLPYLQLDKPPRYQPAEYNNIQFILSGLLEEEAFGDSWESLVQTLIFDPLGMNMTFPNFTSASTSKYADNIASCYVRGQPVDRLVIEPGAPAGAVVSCVADLVKWIQLHLRQSAQLATPTKVPPGPVLVGSQYYRQLLQSNSIFPGIYSAASEYTLGWWRLPYFQDASDGNTQILLTHAGDLLGMSSNIAFFPTLGHGIVVLTNEGSSVARDSLTVEIADLLLGIKEAQPNWREKLVALQLNEYQQEDMKNAQIQQVVAQKWNPPLPLSRYVGVYSSPDDVYGTASISLDAAAGHLKSCGDPFLYTNFTNPTVDVCAWLVPAWNNTFALSNVYDPASLTASNRFIMFILDHAGSSVKNFIASLEPAIAPIVFTKN